MGVGSQRRYLLLRDVRRRLAMQESQLLVTPPRHGLLGSTWEPGSASERLDRGRVQWNLGKFTCGGARLATTDRMQRGGCQPFACTTIRCPREDCKARDSASLVALTRCSSICEARDAQSVYAVNKSSFDQSINMHGVVISKPKDGVKTSTALSMQLRRSVRSWTVWSSSSHLIRRLEKVIARLRHEHESVVRSKPVLSRADKQWLTAESSAHCSFPTGPQTPVLVGP